MRHDDTVKISLIFIHSLSYAGALRLLPGSTLAGIPAFLPFGDLGDFRGCDIVGKYAADPFPRL